MLVEVISPVEISASVGTLLPWVYALEPRNGFMNAHMSGNIINYMASTSWTFLSPNVSWELNLDLVRLSF